MYMCISKTFSQLFLYEYYRARGMRSFFPHTNCLEKKTKINLVKSYSMLFYIPFLTGNIQRPRQTQKEIIKI